MLISVYCGEDAVHGRAGGCLLYTPLMIVYGSQADVSIGKLFVAAVFPGIIMTIAFVIVILTVAHLKPDYIPEVEKLTEEEQKNFWKIVLRPWPIVLLIIVSLGGIWCGFFTPTEEMCIRDSAYTIQNVTQFSNPLVIQFNSVFL